MGKRLILNIFNVRNTHYHYQEDMPNNEREVEKESKRESKKENKKEISCYMIDTNLSSKNIVRIIPTGRGQTNYIYIEFEEQLFRTIEKYDLRSSINIKKKILAEISLNKNFHLTVAKINKFVKIYYVEL